MYLIQDLSCITAYLTLHTHRETGKSLFQYVNEVNMLVCIFSKTNPTILLECRKFYIHEVKHFSVGLPPSEERWNAEE